MMTDTTDSGKMISHTEMEEWSTQTVMFTRGNGISVKGMDTE